MNELFWADGVFILLCNNFSKDVVRSAYLNIYVSHLRICRIKSYLTFCLFLTNFCIFSYKFEIIMLDWVKYCLWNKYLQWASIACKSFLLVSKYIQLFHTCNFSGLDNATKSWFIFNYNVYNDYFVIFLWGFKEDWQPIDDNRFGRLSTSTDHTRAIWHSSRLLTILEIVEECNISFGSNITLRMSHVAAKFVTGSWRRIKNNIGLKSVRIFLR